MNYKFRSIAAFGCASVLGGMLADVAIAYFGDRYRQYRATVGMLFPKIRIAAPRKDIAR